VTITRTQLVVYDYGNSTAVQDPEHNAFVNLRRSAELRSRAGTKEEQVRM
jgi:hypothetical protein